MKYLFLLLCQVAHATPSQDAVNNASRAFYEYEHWDKDVAQALAKYEKKLTPNQRKYGGYLAEIVEVVVHKEVKFVWRFP